MRQALAGIQEAHRPSLHVLKPLIYIGKRMCNTLTVLALLQVWHRDINASRNMHRCLSAQIAEMPKPAALSRTEAAPADAVQLLLADAAGGDG